MGLSTGSSPPMSASARRSSAPTSLWPTAVIGCGLLFSTVGAFIAGFYLRSLLYKWHSGGLSLQQVGHLVLGVWLTSWGISLLLVAWKRWMAARIAASAALFLATAAILGRWFQLPFCPLTQWFTTTSAGTWDCYLALLVGLAVCGGLWQLARPVMTFRQLLQVHLIGLAAVAATPAVFILQVCADRNYGWTGQVWLVATVCTSLIFLLVGYKQAEGEALRRWFWPELIATAGLVTTLWLWQTTRQEQVQRIGRQVQAAAAQAQRDWEETVREQEQMQRQLLERLQAGPLREDFPNVVSRYVGQTPGCLGVWQIDAELSATAVEVRGAARVDLDGLLECEQVRDLLQSGAPGMLVKPRSLGGGRHLIVTYLPVPVDATANGLMALYVLEDRLQY